MIAVFALVSSANAGQVHRAPPRRVHHAEVYRAGAVPARHRHHVKVKPVRKWHSVKIAPAHKRHYAKAKHAWASVQTCLRYYGGPKGGLWPGQF